MWVSGIIWPSEVSLRCRLGFKKKSPFVACCSVGLPLALRCVPDRGSALALWTFFFCWSPAGSHFGQVVLGDENWLVCGKMPSRSLPATRQVPPGSLLLGQRYHIPQTLPGNCPLVDSCCPKAISKVQRATQLL